MIGISDVLVDVTFPIELTNGNDGRGNKFFRSDRVRKNLESTIRILGHQREPFGFPVSIRIVRILGPGQKLWDADSILRGNSKELIDSLVALGWFHNDDQRWVTLVVGEQDSRNRVNGPATRIIVEKSLCNVK